MSSEEKERSVVPVHICHSDTEAQVIIALLRGRGIESFANSEVPHSVLPVTADGLGEVQVLVDEDIAEQAREIIASSETPETETGDG